MGITYHIDAAQGVVFGKAHGDVRGIDLLDIQNRLREDPEFRSDFRHLFDLRDLTRVDVSTAAMRQLAASHPFRKGSRQAYVITHSVASVQARMFRVLVDASPLDLKIFRDIGKAREWLGCRTSRAGER